MFKHFHPYEVFINHNTTTLPPYRFCTKDLKKEDVDFCYGSCDNLLWRALDRIYNLNLLYNNSQKAVTQRKDFLKKEHIGICDIVESCKREKIDASDLGMTNIKLRDILGYLKQYPKITTIIFTGGYCKNSPEYFFRKILKSQKINYTNFKNTVPKTHQFIFDKRTIKTISLTSPSNAANRSIGANKLYKQRKKENINYTPFDFRVEQYKDVFFNN